MCNEKTFPETLFFPHEDIPESGMNHEDVAERALYNYTGYHLPSEARRPTIIGTFRYWRGKLLVEVTLFGHFCTPSTIRHLDSCARNIASNTESRWYLPEHAISHGPTGTREILNRFFDTLQLPREVPDPAHPISPRSISSSSSSDSSCIKRRREHKKKRNLRPLGQTKRKRDQGSQGSSRPAPSKRPSPRRPPVKNQDIDATPSSPEPHEEFRDIDELSDLDPLGEASPRKEFTSHEALLRLFCTTRPLEWMQDEKVGPEWIPTLREGSWTLTCPCSLEALGIRPLTTHCEVEKKHHALATKITGWDQDKWSPNGIPDKAPWLEIARMIQDIPNLYAWPPEEPDLGWLQTINHDYAYPRVRCGNCKRFFEDPIAYHRHLRSHLHKKQVELDTRQSRSNAAPGFSSCIPPSPEAYRNIEKEISMAFDSTPNLLRVPTLEALKKASPEHSDYVRINRLVNTPLGWKNRKKYQGRTINDFFSKITTSPLSPNPTGKDGGYPCTIFPLYFWETEHDPPGILIRGLDQELNPTLFDFPDTVSCTEEVEKSCADWASDRFQIIPDYVKILRVETSPPPISKPSLPTTLKIWVFILQPLPEPTRPISDTYSQFRLPIHLWQEPAATGTGNFLEKLCKTALDLGIKSTKERTTLCLKHLESVGCLTYEANNVIQDPRFFETPTQRILCDNQYMFPQLTNEDCGTEKHPFTSRIQILNTGFAPRNLGRSANPIPDPTSRWNSDPSYYHPMGFCMEIDCCLIPQILGSFLGLPHTYDLRRPPCPVLLIQETDQWTYEAVKGRLANFPGLPNLPNTLPDGTPRFKVLFDQDILLERYDNNSRYLHLQDHPSGLKNTLDGTWLGETMIILDRMYADMEPSSVEFLFAWSGNNTGLTFPTLDNTRFLFSSKSPVFPDPPTAVEYLTEKGMDAEKASGGNAATIWPITFRLPQETTLCTVMTTHLHLNKNCNNSFRTADLLGLLHEGMGFYNVDFLVGDLNMSPSELQFLIRSHKVFSHHSPDWDSESPERPTPIAGAYLIPRSLYPFAPFKMGSSELRNTDPCSGSHLDGTLTGHVIHQQNSLQSPLTDPNEKDNITVLDSLDVMWAIGRDDPRGHLFRSTSYLIDSFPVEATSEWDTPDHSLSKMLTPEYLCPLSKVRTREGFDFVHHRYGSSVLGPGQLSHPGLLYWKGAKKLKKGLDYHSRLVLEFALPSKNRCQPYQFPTSAIPSAKIRDSIYYPLPPTKPTAPTVRLAPHSYRIANHFDCPKDVTYGILPPPSDVPHRLFSLQKRAEDDSSDLNYTTYGSYHNYWILHEEGSSQNIPFRKALFPTKSPCHYEDLRVDKPCYSFSEHHFFGDGSNRRHFSTDPQDRHFYADDNRKNYNSYGLYPDTDHTLNLGWQLFESSGAIPTLISHNSSERVW